MSGILRQALVSSYYIQCYQIWAIATKARTGYKVEQVRKEQEIQDWRLNHKLD